MRLLQQSGEQASSISMFINLEPPCAIDDADDAARQASEQASSINMFINLEPPSTTDDADGAPNAAKFAFTCDLLRPRDATPQPSHDQPSGSGQFSSLAVQRSYCWTAGSGIHVRFLGREGKLKGHTPLSSTRFQDAINKVKRWVQEWENVANIGFVFDQSADAAIRVELYVGHGGASMLGTACLECKEENSPTMELGFSGDDSKDRVTVLHEFGHALGCIHEHQSPRAGIEWNTEAVYTHYETEFGWNKGKVDREVLVVADAATVNASNFDTNSIMIYPIPKSLIKKGQDRVSDKQNTKLSARDRLRIKSIYPPHALDNKKGVFKSWNYRDYRASFRQNRAFVGLGPPCQTKPAVAVGLAQMDLSSKRPFRVEALASDVQQDGFTVQVGTWDDSQISSGGVMWFTIDQPSESSFQTGQVNVGRNGGRTAMGSITTTDVRFPREYGSTPKVVLWLRGFHLDNVGDRRIHVYADGITNTDFKLHVVTDGVAAKGEAPHACLYRAMVTWVAYPNIAPRVLSGICGDGRQEPWQSMKDNRSGFQYTVKLPEASQMDNSRFRVYAGITSFHIGAVDNLRLSLDIEKPDDPGVFLEENSFSLLLSKWSKSELVSASASYLVIYE